MPGIMLFIRNIACNIGIQDIANAIYQVGYGEIYGINVNIGEIDNSAVVEFMYWDCENNDGLVEIVDHLRNGGSIGIPYFTGETYGIWEACKYNNEYESNVSMYISAILDSTNNSGDYIDYNYNYNYNNETSEMSENDILNYSISQIMYDCDSELMSVISTPQTEKYDDRHQDEIKSDFYTEMDMDVSTIAPVKLQAIDTDLDYMADENSYDFYMNLYGDALAHPVRSARVK